jgi:hypothetical protein
MQAARAGGALLLAPIVDRGLKALERSSVVKSRRTAFLVFLLGCLGIAGLVFSFVVFTYA